MTDHSIEPEESCAPLDRSGEEWVRLPYIRPDEPGAIEEFLAALHQARIDAGWAEPGSKPPE